MERYNLIVIGGGSAGLVVAAGAAGLGARVALVEAGPMGGECLNTGCVPSKALIRSAHTARTKRLALHGLPAALAPVSWQAVAERVRDVIDTIAPHDSVERFTNLGVEVLPGRATLASATAVDVALADGSTRRLEAKALVIATGSKPAIPPIPGLEASGYLTNETIFAALARFSGSPRIAVLGGGPIGVELTQALARLGAQVTVIEALPRILPREDPDAGAVIAATLKEDGATVWAGARVNRISPQGGGKQIHAQLSSGEQRTLEVDEIIVAAGRAPHVHGLGLEIAQVAYDGSGVTVDARMRTSCPTIYACGDVTGPYRFTHMANQQARVVIQNALLPLKTRIDYRVVPWCTYTDPEIARVGLNEADAQTQGIPVRVIHVDLADNDRAVCDGDARGFLKILTPPGRDDILGATLVGAHAGELIHEAVLAMSKRLRLRDFAATVHVYPTLAETFRRAGDESRKAGFTPGLQALFRGYLAWARS